MATPRTHPVPRRNRRPMPEWLSADREFWDRYAGGVDERVLAYLDAQGYPQEGGGDEAAFARSDGGKEGDATRGVASVVRTALERARRAVACVVAGELVRRVTRATRRP